MKILILSDASSIHTLKWVSSLRKEGFKLQIFSFFKPDEEAKKKYSKLRVKVISSELKSKIKNLREPNLSKIKYIQSLPILKKVIAKFDLDIVHAHYASSYGVIGYLTRFKPFILSVWGSDICDFPYKNKLNKWILNQVIKNSNLICSTSLAMKRIIEKDYMRFDIEIVPFGVDTKVFRPKIIDEDVFTVGTIKSIESHNGINCIIDAAKIIIHEHGIKINFLIVGDGLLKKSMEQKALKLHLEDYIEFVGFVPHNKVLEYYNKLSVFIAVSERESFGVSILEAAACGLPSITSNIGGLIEVNCHNETGIIIEPKNPKKLAESILKLYKEKSLREKYGKRARERVINDFNWKQNVFKMINLYSRFK